MSPYPPTLPEPPAPERPAPLATSPARPWTETLVRVLDDGIRVPGTRIRFGLDPLLGLIPGVGDVVTGTGSAALLIAGLRRGVPAIVLLRMVMNIAIDTAVGALPVVGDAFDFFFRSNRRNLELIQRYEDDPDAKPTAADYLIVLGGLSLVALNVALPFLIAFALGLMARPS